MSGEGSAKLFNELAFHVLSYIEVMPGVTELDFEERHGVSASDVNDGVTATACQRIEESSGKSSLRVFACRRALAG